MPNSTPIPDCFQPPKGVLNAECTGLLMARLPQSILLIQVFMMVLLSLHMLAPRPNGVLLAFSMPSSNELNESHTAIGPKIYSVNNGLLFGNDRASTINGLTKKPDSCCGV